jgi:hypothetical protein
MKFGLFGYTGRPKVAPEFRLKKVIRSSIERFTHHLVHEISQKAAKEEARKKRRLL